MSMGSFMAPKWRRAERRTVRRSGPRAFGDHRKDIVRYRESAKGCVGESNIQSHFTSGFAIPAFARVTQEGFGRARRLGADKSPVEGVGIGAVAHGGKDVRSDDAPVAQRIRASVFGTEGRGFESLPVYQ